MKQGHRHRSRQIIGLIALATSQLVIALATSQLVIAQPSIQLENFQERLSVDVPVSGRALVGAVFVPAKPSVRPTHEIIFPTLTWSAALAKQADDPICVTLASRDGVYYGEGEISATRLSTLDDSTVVKPVFMPEAQKHLRALAVDDLAMLAMSGNCQIGGANGAAVVHVLDLRRFGNTSTGTAPLQLMLNSLNYTIDVELETNNAAPQAFNCQALDGQQRNKAFNTLCTLDLPAPNVDGQGKLIIHRRRHERRIADICMQLVWAAEPAGVGPKCKP